MIPIQMNSLLVPILHQRGIQDQIGLVDHWQTPIQFWNDNGMSIILVLSRTIFFDMPY